MQFNFVTKMSKSQYGIDDLLKDINEILLISIGQVLHEKRYTFDSVIAVQLRNLLFEKSIEYIDIDFGLLEINGKYLEAKTSDEETVYFLGTNIFEGSTKKISVDDWLQQKLIYIKRKHEEPPKEIDSGTFKDILDKVKDKADKKFFKACYHDGYFFVMEEKTEGALINENVSDLEMKKLWNILEQIGYNCITVSEYIKLIADKVGAHLDTNWPIGLMMIHKDKNVDYIMEMGLYISTVLTDYLKDKGMFDEA